MLMTAVLAGGSVVDLDATVFVQLIVFLALFLVLRSLLFKPLAALLVERERGTQGDVKEAEQRQVEAERKMKKYERELERIRAKASDEREELRNEGRARESEILSAARKESEQIVEKGRRTMDAEASKVRETMNREIDVLAREIASRVIGRDAA